MLKGLIEYSAQWVKLSHPKHNHHEISEHWEQREDPEFPKRKKQVTYKESELPGTPDSQHHQKLAGNEAQCLQYSAGK